ncbi:MAG: DNA-3-methyladenine glycosylase 2 family protein [Roseiarcus sp.]|jgi:DNA-3-methyladenine glycosylase II
MAGTVSKKRGGGKRAKTVARKTRAKKSATKKRKTAVKRGAAAKPSAAPKRRVTKRAPKARVAARRYHPGPPIADEAALAAALAGLQALDPETVGAMLAVGGPPSLRWREPGFAGLVAIIVSQQVSVASANAMVARLQAAFSPLDAASVLAADEATLKACGLSQAKMNALKALAEATANGLDLSALAALEAEAAHDALIAVKGIGPWTADLFLLFCLGHPDAFPAGDLALQEAARLALGLKQRPDARKLEQIAERWRPLRGVAARLLWAYYRGVKRRAGVVGQ